MDKDAELQIIQGAYEHLKKLDATALERALAYLEDRLKAEKPADR
jgi:hypothetical protein